MKKGFLQYLPGNIKNIVKKSLKWIDEQIIEIRLRINQPLQIITYETEHFLTNVDIFNLHS